MEILRTPSIKLHDSCSRKPYQSINYRYPAAVYNRFVSPDDTSRKAVPGSPHPKFYVTENVWYKVAITYNGETVETKKAHFVVNGNFSSILDS